MPQPIPTRCMACGRFLEGGGTKYVVNVSITADFDGFLPDYGDEAAIASEIARTIEKGLQSSAQALEADVHQRFVLLLCRGCKRRFVSVIEPFHPRETGNVQ
ncbi:MAG: hypothetical protein D6795_04105 [Deltaproteobacteria bacterium]|nr:MAG: hypothetical protein D6795_04105 [Deltaproteobacteria bacterium]